MARRLHALSLWAMFLTIGGNVWAVERIDQASDEPPSTYRELSLADFDGGAQNAVCRSVVPCNCDASGCGYSCESGASCDGSMIARETCADDDDCRWHFWGGWLFLKPTFDDTYFAINSSFLAPYPTGTRENNEFDFRSGYRLGAGVRLSDTGREFQVTYTSLESDQTTGVAGEFLWATVGRADFTSAFENYTGTATSSLDFSYRRIDGFFSNPWHVDVMELAFLCGVEFADLRLGEDYVYDAGAVVGTVTQNSSTWGVGPQLGIAIDHELYHDDGWMPGTITLGFLGSASLLVSQTNEEVNNAIDGASILNIEDDNASRIIPAFHLRVGVSYATCGRRCETTYALGYEFNSYVRALSRVAFADDVADGWSTNLYDSVDLQGLVATLAFRY